MTSLEEGAVAEVDGGSEPARRAPVTLRKSPMEMERLVAGDAKARRAEEDTEGGMADSGRAQEDDDEDDEPGRWRFGCESVPFKAAAMSSVEPSSELSVFVSCPFTAFFLFLPPSLLSQLIFFSILLFQMKEQPNRDEQRCSPGTAPFINKKSKLG